MSIKKLLQKNYNNKNNKDFKLIKIIIILLILFFIIKKLSIKLIIFFIYLLFLTNFSLFILLIKFSYIKTIIKFIMLFKIILVKDFSNKINPLILSDNNNIFLSIKLIIIILIIENVRINALFLHINKKIILLTLITE